MRAAGGLCIADEVQVGYGRLGEHFWGFEQQGVVPDVITIAKATGNGFPVGAVITTRAIAEAFAREGAFFASTGGSPASCAAAMAVLDVLERERLQENARVVGDHLKARLEGLIDRHPLCGAVHGMGLYLGLELVRDRETLEPAAEEAYAICERHARAGRDRAADLGRHERAEDQAAAVPDRGVSRLLRRHARPRADDRLVAQ